MWAGENKQREKKEGKTSICPSAHTAAISLKQNTSKNRQPTLFIQDIMVLVKPSGIHTTRGKKMSVDLIASHALSAEHVNDVTFKSGHALSACDVFTQMHGCINAHTHTRLLSGRLKKSLVQKEHRATAFWPAQEYY